MSDESDPAVLLERAQELAATPTVYGADVFKDQVVLVSGGAGGIGLASCVLFGRLGATVVSCSRDPEKMAGLGAALDHLGIPNLTKAMTIRDPEQVNGLIDDIWDRYGRLDVVVNNAGGQFAAPALDISPNGWNAVVDTNLNGTWYMTQAAAQHWTENKHPGCVINVVAVLDTCNSGIPHTMAARGGEIALSKALSVEWGPQDIRINCIAVGVVESPGLAHYPPTARPSFDHNPMRRMGTVQDIAQACVYLAAPSGAFVNGSVLTVDGGAANWGEYWPLGRPEYFNVDY